MATPVLGMSGTGNFTAENLPEDWRTTILYKFPSGEAPFTALTGMLERSSTSYAEFHVPTKDVHGLKVTVNGAHGAGDLTITVDSGEAQRVREGVVLANLTTGERFVVTEDPTSATAIKVKRGIGSDADVIADNEELAIIGTAAAEGADMPSAIHTNESWYEYYTQIFRRSVHVTRTALRANTRLGDVLKEREREALAQFSTDVERAALLGTKYKDTGPNGMPRRFAEGLVPYIQNNASTDNVVTPSGGNLTNALWRTYLATAFSYGSSQKLCILGGHAYGVLEEKFESKVTFDTVAEDQTYGLQLRRWVTGRGEILFLVHPLFTLDSVMTKWMLFVDTRQIKERFVDDLMYIPEREGNGEDGIRNEFLAELGWEWGVPDTHMLVTNVNAHTT